MSLTYVITSLFRGDDIEQTEYLIAQLVAASTSPRAILLFNGGFNPRGDRCLERKYPGLKILEIDVPPDWRIRNEFHYYCYVCTQIYKHIETDYYLKMDRDVCIFSRHLDQQLIEFMSQNPETSAAGSLRWCVRNLHLDSANLFTFLPRPVSFSNDQVLNGGIEIFRTVDMRSIGPMVEEHGRRLWQDSLAVGEDDLISFILVGNNFRIENCHGLLSLGYIKPGTVVRNRYDANTLEQIRLEYAPYWAVHGFKPFSQYRRFYAAMHRIEVRRQEIGGKFEPNSKDLWMGKRMAGDLARSVATWLIEGNHLGETTEAVILRKRLLNGEDFLSVLADTSLATEVRILLMQAMQEYSEWASENDGSK